MHHVSQVRFPKRLDVPPSIEGALSIVGDGRSWSVVHASPVESLRNVAADSHGEVTESRIGHPRGDPHRTHQALQWTPGGSVVVWTPAVAVTWESWRLTRRRVSMVPALAAVCGWLLVKYHNSTTAFVALFALAVLAAFSMPGLGIGSGFPLSQDFSRPIRTSTLVAMPLACVAMAASACYLVPAVLLRALTGAAFPLIPVAAVIGALAAEVAAYRWSTRSTAVRIGLTFPGIFVWGLLYQYLDPFRGPGHFVDTRAISPRMFVLSGMGYLVVALFIGAMYLGTVWAVERQRHGDDELLLGTNKEPERRGDILAGIRNACFDLFRWHCPISSPTAAEVWFELQSYGIAVLVIGALAALCIPVLINWGAGTFDGIAVVLAACTLLAPLAAGVSASIWNRRNAPRAQVSAFEAARPIGSAKLIGIQILVTAVCISGAWILASASLWLSLPLIKGVHGRGSLLARALEPFQTYGLRLLADAAIGFVWLATLLAFLMALRIASSYAQRFWLAAAGVVLYIVGLTIGIARGWIDGALVGVHLWALAIAIPVGTLLVLGRALACGALAPRQIAGTALIWLLFAALYLDTLRNAGAMQASPALAAMAFASTLLPLAAVGLAPWSFSRIRHA